MKYWLMKSEPDVFSIDDLAACPKQTEPWDGIRNYQARNFMRDVMSVGDRVLFYHSNATPPGIVGTAEIVSGAYPDPTAFEPESKYYDAKSDPENPRWLLVDVKFLSKFKVMIPLQTLRETPELDGMLVIKRGQRLSIQPVEEEHYNQVLRMSEA